MINKRLTLENSDGSMLDVFCNQKNELLLCSYRKDGHNSHVSLSEADTARMVSELFKWFNTLKW